MAALFIGGAPLLVDLAKRALNREFGSDLLAALSIVTSAILGEYLAGSIVVLMLSGGAALEQFATRRASSVLGALARRMPRLAHCKQGDHLTDIDASEIQVGERLVVFPHEICPADGLVLEGHGSMDESYLTGEPFLISKAPGARVLSGALNGEMVLTISVSAAPADSRYTKIPLLLAIPIAIIGAISVAASRGIIIKDPSMLERIDTCRTAIFDKTGTLTYGRPELTSVSCAPGESRERILRITASLEQYSKHPLATAIRETAKREGISLPPVTQMSERPGQGLHGIIDKPHYQITGRKQLLADDPAIAADLPTAQAGMECVLLADGKYAAALLFRDEPRKESRGFVGHLGSRHHFARALLLSGDFETEVRYLANRVGITELLYGQSPEQKVAVVQAEARLAHTLFVGDGINDAPAMQAATVGVAFGPNSDLTAESADAVVLESSFGKVDELIHIGRRMRRIALQSAVGGMAASMIGTAIAAAGYLPPVAGAMTQEVIDVVAVLNALRVLLASAELRDDIPSIE